VSELEKKVQWSYPAQLRAIVAVLIGQQCVIRQRSIDEVVGMRVMAVQIADVRKEPAGAHAQSLRQRQCIDVRFLDVRADLAVVIVIADRELAVKFVVDIGCE